MTEKKEKTPLFHVVKRSNIPLWQSILIRLGFVVGAVLVGMLVLLITRGINPFEALYEMFRGSFASPNRFFNFLKDGALLLIVGLALVPSFKMKFWNLGGNGQILMGALVTVMCMYYLGNILPAGYDWLIIICMFISAVLAGAIWALIPALFKAFFNTNESLFTLMMNYIAVGLVSAFITIVSSGGGSHFIDPDMICAHGRIPQLFGKEATLIVIASLIILAFMIYYLRFSKHGYELSVVGESENTARYVGINVKKVIIRTILLSGAICGIAGFLISGAITYSVTETSAANMGFTAIIAVWLAKFNPFITAATSFFVVFVTTGMGQVQLAFSDVLKNNASGDIVMGLIYFFIIGCEFFIEYKIIWNKKSKNPLENVISEPTEVPALEATEPQAEAPAKEEK